MENNQNSIESLYERAVEYGKTSYELIKLRAVDKTSDIGSSFVPHSVVFYFLLLFVLFISLGLAFWIGELLNQMSYGFFIVAGLHVVIGVAFYLLLHKPLKKRIGNYLIKSLLK